MRIVTVVLLALTTIGLLPSAASATHFGSVPVVDGRCEGWTLDVVVRFRTATFAADLEYNIELLDADLNVLESISWTGSVERPQEGSLYQAFQFGGDWSVELPVGVLTLRGTATVSHTWSGGFDVDTAAFGGGVACEIVQAQASTFSQIKGLYR